MVRQEQIEALCRKIVREFSPDKIVLFGSQAQGSASPDSDVDLLVVMPFAGSTLRQTTLLYRAVKDRTIAVDLVVRTPEEIARRLRENDPFIGQIMRTGKVLHEGRYA